jgi:hypothetical protein
MERYVSLQLVKDTNFRRLTGVKRRTFEAMLEVLDAQEKERKALGGKPNRLTLPDRLLMTLEYLREYRTYFHISQSYGISESACYRNIRWVEQTLIASKLFHLPGRKALHASDMTYEVLVVDATESPIERPKKNKKPSIPERRNATHSKHKLH